MRRILTVLLLGIGGLALTGLAIAYLARPNNASSASATPDTVVIRDYAFHPATLTVTPGTTVTWVNRDPVAHTVTSKDGGWGSALLQQGQEFSYTFAEPGTYNYFCQPHPWMEGRIVVGEATDGTAPAGPTSAATPAEPNDQAPSSGPPAGPVDWPEQMRQWMDQMHGPGSFDAMRQWMEERWGPGAFDSMIQNCPQGGQGGMMGGTTGGGMMGGGTMGGGMMGGGSTGGGMMSGGGMMGGR